MKNPQLKQTHKKLTLLFTGLVFCIVSILGISTLGVKYFNELRIQKTQFYVGANEIQKILKSENIVLQSILFNQVHQKRKFGEQEDRSKLGLGKPFLSFIILDRNNDIVFENLLESVNFGSITMPQNQEIHKSANLLYQSLDIKSAYGEKVLIFSSLRYDIQDLARDIAILFMIIGSFSMLFYFLGSRFVERALKPVEENLQDMIDFIHNAGHELKTPLAVIRGNLQILQAEEVPDTQLLQKSIVQVDHINLLIENLRELSEIGKLSEKQNFNLKLELEKIVGEFQEFAKEKGVALENTVIKNFFLHTNISELHVCISNIIKNALKYTPSGGNVKIELFKNILTITDSGIGIEQQEQEKIFERFYQGEKHRSQEGFGIGLSLVKKIAENNGWNISLESEVGKGTKFSIVF